MKALEVKKDIYWVGALDPNLRIFDIVMYTPFGTTYNSYVARGSEKIAVFETVKEKFFDEYLERLKSLDINIENIDYIVVNHTEPDHAGSVGKLLEISKNAKVVGSATAINFLKQIVNRDFEYITVKDGDIINLGNKTLSFISAPFLHWPDSMFTYVVEDKVLITCDSFGSHYCNAEMYNDLNQSDENYREALKYYFDGIMSPFKPYVLKAIDKIKDLSIDIICPGHGPILREDPWNIVNYYKEWSLPRESSQEPQITLCYVSAYGYTEAVAKKIEQGIKTYCNFKVNMYDVIHSDMNDILNSIDKSEGVIFGSPTMNGDALKPIWDILINLNPIVHGGKVASAFGSYGWSGEAVPNIEDRLKQINLDLYPSMKYNFKPTEGDLNFAFKFGESFAEKIAEKLKITSCPVKPSTQKRWKCVVCGEEFDGPNPPEICPACGASADQFIQVSQDVVTFSSDKKEKFLIIGNGAAGYYAADAIRKRNKQCEIEIISDEPYLTYYRPSISDGISENLKEDTFYLSPKQWYVDNNIILTLGVQVESLNPEEKNILLKNGSAVSYDKLILANGSQNFMIPVDGVDKPGVFTLRNLKDLEAIRSKMKTAKNVVIVGGGLLGLEAAYEISKTGLDVCVVEVSNSLLTKQLDSESSLILKTAVENQNITVILSDSVTSIVGEKSVSSIKLKSGKTLEADLVLFSTGIAPNKNIAHKTNIITSRGILINDRMETNVKDIYACGDIAEFKGRVYGNWPAAVEMGKAAGMNAVGESKDLSISLSAISFNAMGLELLSVGEISKEGSVAIALKDDANKIYKKLFFTENIITGGILIGDNKSSAKLISAIESSKSIKEVLDIL
ncbi:FAD-dependent oxidoreductase [Clostridium sp. FP2]|uniref:FAD-dependent oxidoreductase n=1 Tax=Clostridium TaxID=1485 RepID=UPI0013E9316D|nr:MULTISPECIES: FAD-dependent oxidoreductase [Clostridium]MBW9155614.1 FAD-dependent oxidoreductase [Clostridium tagluense]MBZ9625431.1 FAD-dependent oxidoreductase [Clostridium sp. FP2]WLC65218.1 FAD-dependent oxidoreductase [Clostridium tagluense]